MMKMKGIVAMESSSSPSSLSPSPYENQKTRFKYRSLMQDYHELYKETETKKNRLQMIKQNKFKLLTEVSFLRHRYKYLIQKQSTNLQRMKNHLQPQISATGRKSLRKEKSYTANDAVLPPLVPRFDLNQKGKTCSGKGSTLLGITPSFDSKNQKQKTYSGKKAALQNSAATPDLNQKERLYTEKESSIGNLTPIFDLNLISTEEEELQANGELMKIEEPKITSVRSGTDEQQNDINISACRNAGNGSTRAGKRKITWHDQVALRV